MDEEYEKLLRVWKGLREKLIEALVARDELIFWTAADVEADYMQKLGILEYKVIEFRYLAARMKMKVQLLQRAAEEQTALLLPQLETKLDEQLKDQMKQVVNRRRHLNVVLSRRPMDRLAGGAAAAMAGASPNQVLLVQMKQMYRSIVERYHPILHVHQSQDDAAFFGSCAAAFRARDYLRLRQFDWMAMPISNKKSADPGAETMRKELPRLRDLWVKTTEEIRRLKGTFPLDQEGILADDARLRERQKLLEEEIERQRGIYREEEAKLTELLGE